MQPTPLDALHDVIAPEKVSAWPPGPAWWLLIALCLLALFTGLYLWRLRRRHNKAKRHAKSLSNGLGQEDISELHQLIKRLTRHYYGVELAAQSGEAWCHTLKRLTQVSFSAGELETLYRPQPADSALAEKFKQAIAQFNTRGDGHV